MKPIFVYGPYCSGKTLNKDAIIALLGAATALDFIEWCALPRLGPGTAVGFVTCELAELPYLLRRQGYKDSAPIVSISAVKLLLGRKWVGPKP